MIGFDIVRHDYGTGRYPSQLVLQDILTLHGSQFRKASLIVASPPCQTYSYMAQPWSRAKTMAEEYRSGARCVEELNALFNACFRIQAEASAAAGQQIPLIVENVKGAQPWVGSAKAHFGTFYLWGDVPALMPTGTHRKQRGSGAEWFDIGISHLPSNSPRRKAASAAIAKIPLPLSLHIAQVFKP